MSLRRFFVTCFAMTLLALIYIYMQVTIYDLAYQGKKKENQAFQLADRNAQTSVRIAKLKSAQHLGGWFFENHSHLDFVNQSLVVDVEVSPREVAQARGVPVATIVKKPENMVDKIFNLISIAEAKPIR